MRVYLLKKQKNYISYYNALVYLQITNSIKAMYIYNITINIDDSVHAEWLVWIQEHIQKVLATGYFLSAKMTQVLVEEEMGGLTYSIQYTAKTREDLDAYYKNDAEKLRTEGLVKFADKMLAFRTELKVIQEFYPTVSSN